ncbi:hypothetical protein JTE90_018068 [Oedothorax gibbosus]|uniref:MADF domain-containing protein n=1 Tax=Oedothorax gibbosus TaxID=931172 RepID=A0AAV6UE11_9ARAC|nr:hypothetical protein JTE90_018068 [Oedothorax gibbosus]
MSVAEVKNKKHTLMSTYRRQRKIKEDFMRSGVSESEVFEPTWFAYSRMDEFLQGVADCGKTPDSLSHQTVEVKQESPQESLAPSPVAPSSSAPSPSDPSSGAHHQGVPSPRAPSFGAPSPGAISPGASSSSARSSAAAVKERQKTPREKRKKIANEMKEAKSQMNATFATLNDVLSKRKEPDDCDLYGQLLASKLRQYTMRERHIIMHEIDSLLLNKPPPTTTTFAPYIVYQNPTPRFTTPSSATFSSAASTSFFSMPTTAEMNEDVID